MLLKAINYWSYDGGLQGTLDPFEFLRKAKHDGFEAAELCIGDDGPMNFNADEEMCHGLVRCANELGLKLPSVASGTYWGYNLASESEADREKAVSTLLKMIQISSWLGAKTLLTIPGAVDVFFLPTAPVQSYDEVRSRAIDGLRRVLPIAEKLGIRLGIENVWNKFLLSPTEMAGFIDELNSPCLGSYFDVGNVLPFGYPEHWLRILGKRVVGIHFKDFRRAVGTAEGFVDILEGDVNWPEVMKAIGEIGYEGPVVAEMIPHYRYFPDVRVKNASVAMDAILGKS